MTGDNIKKIRIEKKLTQKKLGELCGIDEANLRKYENGRLEPSLSTIRKIAAALNVTLSELIEDWEKFSEKEIKEDFASAKLVNITTGEHTFMNANDFHDYLFEKVITDNFKLLNKDGKKRLSDYSTDLTKIPEYQKKDE